MSLHGIKTLIVILIIAGLNQSGFLRNDAEMLPNAGFSPPLEGYWICGDSGIYTEISYAKMHGEIGHYGLRSYQVDIKNSSISTSISKSIGGFGHIAPLIVSDGTISGNDYSSYVADRWNNTARYVLTASSGFESNNPSCLITFVFGGMGIIDYTVDCDCEFGLITPDHFSSESAVGWGGTEMTIDFTTAPNPETNRTGIVVESAQISFEISNHTFVDLLSHGEFMNRMPREDCIQLAIDDERDCLVDEGGASRLNRIFTNATIEIEIQDYTPPSVPTYIIIEIPKEILQYLGHES